MMVKEGGRAASGHRTRYGLFLCCLLLVAAAGVGRMAAAADDPLEDYVRACETPAVVGGWAASEATCSALAERLSALRYPAPESRLALFKAKAWLGHYSDSTEQRCNEFRAVAEGDHFADRPDVLFELALCSLWPMPSGPDGVRRGQENLVAGLQAALVLAPDHEDALDLLVYKVRALGYGYGVDAAALAGYAATLYETTGSLEAAVAVYEAALDAGDPETAEAVRGRVRRDLELDALDYGAGRVRQESLTLACSDRLFDLGLEDACFSALEMLAETYADHGEALPLDVLGHVVATSAMLRLQLATDRAQRGKARLRAVLDAHPEPFRSSEHYRAYAATASSWGNRIEALRRAVELDGGNLKARCELAGALALTGAGGEAWSIYAGLASADERPPCEAVEALQEMELLEQRGGKPVVGLDDDYPGGGP